MIKSISQINKARIKYIPDDNSRLAAFVRFQHACNKYKHKTMMKQSHDFRFDYPPSITLILLIVSGCF